jgi:2-amino-4-hydroxy-6-hydroxymethyldihydropteridine diphosphokinase
MVELDSHTQNSSAPYIGFVSVELPPWAQVTEKRRAHIQRVAGLLEQWSEVMQTSPEERRDWLDAARWHDALRDAPREELRRLAGEAPYAPEMLHGPASAEKLVQQGERRMNVLDAIRYHTVGSPAWDRTGRALYMADFLEPGRSFSREDRAFLSAQVPHDFDRVFRQVVRMRLVYALNEGHTLFPETVQLWNSIR